MAINAGTVAAYLMLDTSQYMSALADAQQRMIGFALEMNRPMTTLNNAFAQGTLDMLNSVTTARKEFLHRWLSDYSAHVTSKKLVMARESVAHSNEINRRLFSYADAYRLDVLNFSVSEEAKTDSQRREAAVRKVALRGTVVSNRDILQSFVPVFREIGTEYGEALLKGIKSTGSRIKSHLNDVASAVRAASAGGSVSFNAYATGTGNAARGLAVVGEYGRPEIVDFSGGEQVLSFNESVAIMGKAANEAAALGLAARSMITAASSASVGAAGSAVNTSQALGDSVVQDGKTGGLVYSPTYISPVAASIDELMVKDQIMMRRLGLSF